ncbi:helix-turn-helix domain-containing protein [Streptomyces sp. AK02-01A]|uniref:AraC-like ligand-binding domain-containing protein n=1 Tax=Streptomyces sp. AK02-01A TaxID=3028648 RepID=UPI0029ADCCFF|nr:helix-turn-helix domain-containing protein [Streptomyces sp. AK02-01A]MDX3850816.1 helix-turn-helix domain-containing protein [Streptomyces sp. AK02-01A]
MSPDSSRLEPDQLPGTLYTTDSLPTHRRRAYWCESLSRTFGSVGTTVPDEVYSGKIRTVPLGRLRAVTVDADRLSALRTRRLIAQGGDDEYVVVKLLDRGVARLEQDGREALLGPGDVFVYDRARPFRLHFPQSFRTKSLVLPRDILGLSEPDVTRVTATPIGPDSPMGGLLSPFLAGLVDSAGTFPPHTGELMARNIVDLLGVLAHEGLGRTNADTPGANRALLLRIQAFIDRHLADPDLTPQVIARVHRISLRHLHRLFESEDVTVGRWVQRRRLEECGRDLVRRANSSTIAAVAHRWGFTSAPHFSRVFRAAYGMSPREWRDTQSLTLHTPSSTELMDT